MVKIVVEKINLVVKKISMNRTKYTVNGLV